MKKGIEKAMEMVFIVFVLLIVTSVILGMFLKVVRPSLFRQKCNKVYEIQQAKQDCMQSCELINTFGGEEVLNDEIEYCAKTEKIDGDCDGLYNEVLSYGTIESCEDRVPCFLLYSCNELTPQKCRELLLKNNQQKFNQLAYTNISGDCNLPDDNFNWVKKYNYVIGTP